MKSKTSKSNLKNATNASPNIRASSRPKSRTNVVVEDENDDEDQIATDLTIRIGRMIICENVTGFFRPQYAEEVLSALSMCFISHLHCLSMTAD